MYWSFIWTCSQTDRLIQRKLKLYRRKSASMVKIEIENGLGILLHVDTIRKRAHKVGQVVRKKPYVNKINRGKRLKVAKDMFEKPVDFWKNLVWSNESKFNLFDLDSKVMVSRSPRKEFDPKCTIPTIKQSGVLGLCLPSGSWKTVCIMDRCYYRDILEQNLQPSINYFKLDQRCIFMHLIMILNIPQD